MLKRFPEYGRKAPETPSFQEGLRRVILGRIHAGSLQPGDRLPSVREVASRSRVDHRVVATAYRALQQEGLVEVRSKSGVYVSACFGRTADGTSSTSWAADVLFEAWQKGIARSSLCGLFGGMLTSPLRCGCIESNEDHMVALAAEIEEGLSLEVVPMYVDAGADESAAPPEDLADVDVIVTTIFHASYARAIGAAAGKPVAVMNLRPEFAAEIGRRLRGGATTAVIADAGYAGRGREFFTALGTPTRMRFLTVAEARAEGVDLESEAVLATRAARRRAGLEDFHLVPSPRPVSDESARVLCETVAAVTPRRRPRLTLPGSRPAAPGAALARRAEPSLREEPPMEASIHDVERVLREEGLFETLRFLNGTTPHRFTGVYRFEPGWVRSVALFDRENPHLRVGADVPMKESYCMLTADAGAHYRIDDALADPRLAGHKARGAVLSYCGVHLLDSEGASWGTLCHYDFKPARIADETIALLKAVQSIMATTLSAATPHVRLLPDCTGARTSAGRNGNTPDAAGARPRRATAKARVGPREKGAPAS